VHDRDGKPVQGLQPSDITVLDNGSPIKVASVEAGDAIPIRLAILLYSDRTNFKMEQEAAIQLWESYAHKLIRPL